MLLTELTTLEPKDQFSKSKVQEKPPDTATRIKTFKSNLDVKPTSPTRQSLTQGSRFQDTENSDFNLSPEILSEKLYDSVKMIRDLMNSNKKLKDMISEFTQQKKSFETESCQLLNENQELAERNDMLETMLNMKSDRNKYTGEVIQLRQEKEELIKRIAQLEQESKSQSTSSSNKEWEWRSKRTVLRNRKQHLESIKPLSLVSDRNYDHRVNFGRITPKSIYRPHSQDFVFDNARQDAIPMLSQILMQGGYNNNTH